jgi:hypothetical protein
MPKTPSKVGTNQAMILRSRAKKGANSVANKGTNSVTSRPSTRATRAASTVEEFQIDQVNDDELTSSYSDEYDDGLWSLGSSEDDFDSEDSTDGSDEESSGSRPRRPSIDDDNSGSESELLDQDSSESVDAHVRRWNRGSRSTATLGEWSRIYKTMQRWSAISLLVLPNL